MYQTISAQHLFDRLLSFCLSQPWPGLFLLKLCKRNEIEYFNPHIPSAINGKRKNYIHGKDVNWYKQYEPVTGTTYHFFEGYWYFIPVTGLLLVRLCVIEKKAWLGEPEPFKPKFAVNEQSPSLLKSSSRASKRHGLVTSI